MLTRTLRTKQTIKKKYVFQHFLHRLNIICLLLAGVVYEIVPISMYYYARTKRHEALLNFRVFVTVDLTRITSPIFYWHKKMNDSKLARSFVPNFLLYSAIAIETTVLVVLFKRSIQARKSLTGTQGTKKISTREAKLVKSVIAVCLIYMVTNLPQNIWDTAWSIKEFYMFLSATITKLFRSFNHAMNIFVYLAINPRYRHHFKLLFCRCLKEKSKTSQ